MCSVRSTGEEAAGEGTVHEHGGQAAAHDGRRSDDAPARLLVVEVEPPRRHAVAEDHPVAGRRSRGPDLEDGPGLLARISFALEKPLEDQLRAAATGEGARDRVDAPPREKRDARPALGRPDPEQRGQRSGDRAVASRDREGVDARGGQLTQRRLRLLDGLRHPAEPRSHERAQPIRQVRLAPDPTGTAVDEYAGRHAVPHGRESTPVRPRHNRVVAPGAGIERPGRYTRLR